MRALAAFAVIAAALSFDARDANAQGKYWPWCSRYGWTIVCAYDNYQQCAAAVSGAGGACQLNVEGPPVMTHGGYGKVRHAHGRYHKRARHARHARRR